MRDRVTLSPNRIARSLPLHRSALVGALLGTLLLGTLLLGGCSGGGSASASGTSASFAVVRTSPANRGTVFLNDPIRIDFTTPVEFASANFNTITFQVFDGAGNALPEQVAGTFRITRTPGDATIGRRLEFIPRFPSNNTFDNGGFRPGRTYLVQLVGGEQRRGNVLIDIDGKPLTQPVSFAFETVEGSTPTELFRDTLAGGPRRTGFSIPGGTTAAELNRAGRDPVEIALDFDQPLNPHSANVPTGLSQSPGTRDPDLRGPIFLQYDDDELGAAQWIPARVVLAQNTLTGSQVRLLPLGLLPSHAEVEVIVEPELEDMAGESNERATSYDRVFARFTTQAALEPQFDALVESFDIADSIDFGAAFTEPAAEVGKGYLRANFEFEGTSTLFDYEPNATEVVLDTDFTQITPKSGTPFNVFGGVFQFRNVDIPAGVTVSAVGSQPMVWLVTGDMAIDGTLQVDGGQGERSNTWRAASFPVLGGTGVTGSGDGGRGSPNEITQSVAGEDGFGPGGQKEAGGMGGRLSDRACGRGSGGGGGSFATAGDPSYKHETDGGVGFVQQIGQGGFGCLGKSGTATRTLPGGLPGPRVFSDQRTDNDYWGSGVDLHRQIRIDGEMMTPTPGSGGGGGGDYAKQASIKNWLWNNTGGGGGAGGGVLVIKCLGEISIGPNGRLSADGGHGGGGQLVGQNDLAGGGGGGSGGMVVLMAGKKIRIATHGETYASAPPDAGANAPPGAYSFAISADGGVGIQDGGWLTKYPPSVVPGAWDDNPSGAFGGMGVVQLMAPAGDNVDDGTNTALDDNIEIVQIDASGTTLLRGAEKERYLAWRGFPDDRGVWVDDAGEPTYYNDPDDPRLTSYPAWAAEPWDPAEPTEFAGHKAEGDIRPAPVLLPAPFGHKSRVRSEWIDLGVGAVRLPTATHGEDGPRRIRENRAIQPPLLRGPHFHFAGTQATDRQSAIGYVDYEPSPFGELVPVFPTVGPEHPVEAITPGQAHAGQLAHLVELSSAGLGAIRDRYAHYAARLLDASGQLLSQHRILGHDDRRLWLAPDRGPLNDPGRVASVQIVAQFFDLTTSGTPGLGPTYTAGSGRETPIASVRFGFAFHTDPGDPSGRRFPRAAGTFLYDGDDSDPAMPVAPMDLANPASREIVRAMGFRYVRWDVLFNTRYSEEEANNTRSSTSLSPASPRPTLHWFVLPYRF